MLAPASVPALAQPAATNFPYCNPEAAPPDPGVRAQWQTSCAQQMQAQQPQQPAQQQQGQMPQYYGNSTRPVTRYPYCNPEAAPADPGIRADWQYSCALQMQQQAQPATP